MEGGSERCGLCFQGPPVVRAECCGNWICAPVGARAKCEEKHSRFTICGIHDTEGHDGDWKTCASCRDEYEPEMYVYYGTNEYNFDRLKEVPEYAPTFMRGIAGE